MKKKILFIVLIIFIAVVIVGGYFWLQSLNKATGWKTFISPDKGVSFKYPQDLSTKYIHPQEWPPQIIATSDSFSCDEGGLGINGRPDMTIRKTIDDRVYCIRNVSEEAAGSVYTTYTYKIEKDSRLIIISFILQYLQCDNYGDLQKTECEQERQTFDLDILIDDIVQTVQL